MLAGVVVVHEMQNEDGHSGPPAAGGSRSSPTASPGSATPAIDLTIPATFAGTWSGQVKQPPNDVYSVRVTLPAGQSAGQVKYTLTGGLTCAGSLQLVHGSAKKLKMSQGIIQGQSKCDDGQVTLTSTSATTIWFNFGSSTPYDATGTLTKH